MRIATCAAGSAKLDNVAEPGPDEVHDAMGAVGWGVVGQDEADLVGATSNRYRNARHAN